MRSFENSVRLAVGLPTSIESGERLEAGADTSMARTSDVEQKLIAKFYDTVAVSIDLLYRRAEAVLLNADIYLVQSYVLPDDELLAELAYTVGPRFISNQEIGCQKSNLLVGPLFFSLSRDGRVSASTPVVVSTPPTLHVSTKEVDKPLECFTCQIIADAFVNYIRLARSLIHNAQALP